MVNIDVEKKLGEGFEIKKMPTCEYLPQLDLYLFLFSLTKVKGGAFHPIQQPGSY